MNGAKNKGERGVTRHAVVAAVAALALCLPSSGLMGQRQDRSRPDSRPAQTPHYPAPRSRSGSRRIRSRRGGMKGAPLLNTRDDRLRNIKGGPRHNTSRECRNISEPGCTAAVSAADAAVSEPDSERAFAAAISAVSAAGDRAAAVSASAAESVCSAGERSAEWIAGSAPTPHTTCRATGGNHLQEPRSSSMRRRDIWGRG